MNRNYLAGESRSPSDLMFSGALLFFLRNKTNSSGTIGDSLGLPSPTKGRLLLEYQFPSARGVIFVWNKLGGSLAGKTTRGGDFGGEAVARVTRGEGVRTAPLAGGASRFDSGRRHRENKALEVLKW